MVILRRCSGSFLSITSATWLLPSLAIAEIVNRTIDDTFGDSQTGLEVKYLPETPGVWNNQDCGGGCKINPDVASAFKGTYTAATYYPSYGSINITMQFNGTAIYVFFIIANDQGIGITTLTEANFILDGNSPQIFLHTPNLLNFGIEFNQLVFSQQNLTNSQHTLVIVTSEVQEQVYVNFDYAIYTHDDDAPLFPLTNSSPVLPITTPGSIITATDTTMAKDSVTPGVTVTATSTVSQSSSALVNFPNTKSGYSFAGLIIGVVIFAIALISFFIFFYIYRQRIKKSSAKKDNIVSPFILSETNASTQRTGPLYGAVKEKSTSDTTRSRLRSMREYVTYLQDQQQSARAQESSFNPPPGYIVSSMTSRY